MTYICIFLIGFILCKLWDNYREGQKGKQVTSWQSEYICKEGNVNDKVWIDMGEFLKNNFVDGDKAIIYLEKVNK